MNSMTVITVLSVLIALNIIFFLVIFSRLKRREGKEDSKSFDLLLNQLNEFSRTVDAKISTSSKNIQDSLMDQSRHSVKIIQDITEKLTRLDETNRQVISFADQLQSLQDILKNPKQRGILGEYYLETLLKNVLPPGSFQMQYMFKDGTIVDAIVRVKDKIIPVDSKFSLENYNRIVEEKNEGIREQLERTFISDLKNRIAETSKYVKPAEGTMDFAFMFIPHEAIYYDLLVNKIGVLKDEDSENLLQRAASKYKVLIVSPTSFLAYLQTVLQGLKALKIEETAKDIIKRVEELGKHIKSYEDYHQKLGNSLSVTVSHFNNSYKELKKVDKDVLRITDEAIDIQPKEIAKPEMDL